jgi:hypothetical protein
LARSTHALTLNGQMRAVLILAFVSVLLPPALAA